MNLIRWYGQESPLSQFERMSRGMDRWLNAFGNRSALAERCNCAYPALNIYDDGESTIVRAEVPGVDPKDLDISVTGDTLVLKGKRVGMEFDEEASYHRRERDFGEFRRAFTLPDQVDSSKVMAQCKDGILEIRLPRAEQAKQRKIQIKSA